MSRETTQAIRPLATDGMARPTQAAYIGRFAPSPTGPLHAGSLVAALASWLDARAHAGTWLVRIEDLDPPRVVPGAADRIVAALARCGMVSDAPIVRQSERDERYAEALRRLAAQGALYPCACSRRESGLHAAAQPVAAGVYPGTCRPAAPCFEPVAPARRCAWRLRIDDADPIGFTDRACGRFEQALRRDVGDFVLRRADGCWAYQLAVVVDDALQGVTDVVRGADLLDNTPRQILLQRRLDLPTPRYLHVPVVRSPDGQKLSKQTGATALELDDPLLELRRAARHLGLPAIDAGRPEAFLAAAVGVWRARFGAPHAPRIE
jgi:glutamyl-Q tRNA(Asp) synthetase